MVGDLTSRALRRSAIGLVLDTMGDCGEPVPPPRASLRPLAWIASLRETQGGVVEGAQFMVGAARVGFSMSGRMAGRGSRRGLCLRYYKTAFTFEDRAFKGEGKMSNALCSRGEVKVLYKEKRTRVQANFRN